MDNLAPPKTRMRFRRRREVALAAFLILSGLNLAGCGVNGDFGDARAREDSMAVGVLRLAGANPVGVGGKFTLGVGFARPLLDDTTTIRVQVMEMYAAGTFADLLPSVTPVKSPLAAYIPSQICARVHAAPTATNGSMPCPGKPRRARRRATNSARLISISS